MHFTTSLASNILALIVARRCITDTEIIFGSLIICLIHEPILSVKFYCVVEVRHGCCRFCCSHIHVRDCRIPITGCRLLCNFALHSISVERGTTSCITGGFKLNVESNHIGGEHWHCQSIGEFDVLVACVFIDK